MWTKEITDMIVSGVWATLYMTLASTILGYIFGLPMGVLLAITDKEGLTPNAIVYKILDVIANIVRSIPFLILLILLIPFTKLIVGQSYGSTATVVPLVIAAIPFIARMVESSIKEVDPGVIEAAQFYGSKQYADCYEGSLSRSQNIFTYRSNNRNRNNSWLFCNGRLCRRWWTR